MSVPELSGRNRTARVLGWSLAVIVVALCMDTLRAEPVSGDRLEPYDGDTVYVDGKRPGIRLVGFDTPERPPRAQCDGEALLALKATNRLRAIIRASQLDLTIVPCACKPGTVGTKYCNHGRPCGVLKSNGTNVGEILIAEGLAVPFVCSKTRCPKKKKGIWCESRRIGPEPQMD